MFSSNTIYPSVHFPHISGDYNHVSRYKFNIIKLTGLNWRGKIFVDAYLGQTSPLIVSIALIVLLEK